MDREGLEEEKQRYKFFLGSSLREKEVMFGEWDDIDFTRGTFRVHAKKDVGFTVKNHEDRRVPLPTENARPACRAELRAVPHHDHERKLRP
jgi:integrase